MCNNVLLRGLHGQENPYAAPYLLQINLISEDVILVKQKVQTNIYILVI